MEIEQTFQGDGVMLEKQRVKDGLSRNANIREESIIEEKASMKTQEQRSEWKEEN